MPTDRTQTTACRTDASEQAFKDWWRRISVPDEPLRKPPQLAKDAFSEGWSSAIEFIMLSARLQLAKEIADAR